MNIDSATRYKFICHDMDMRYFFSIFVPAVLKQDARHRNVHYLFMNHTASDKVFVYLLTGSNLGDRAALLQKAIALLAETAERRIVSSSVYETEPWGFSHRNSFYNQALGFFTKQKPHDLLETLLKIEKKLGRIRKPGDYKARRMDIDILFYGNAVIRQPDLVVPHPLLQDRRFALTPLAEIAPDLIHPVMGISIRQMLKDCSDKGWIRKVN